MFSIEPQIGAKSNEEAKTGENKKSGDDDSLIDITEHVERQQMNEQVANQQTVP